MSQNVICLVITHCSTCRRLQSLVTDRSVWSGDVRIILHAEYCSPENHPLIDLVAALKQQPATEKRRFQTARVTMAIESADGGEMHYWAAQLVTLLLSNQQRRQMNSLEICVPAAMHATIMEAVADWDGGQVIHLSIRDSLRDDAKMIQLSGCRTPHRLLSWLNHDANRTSLRSLDLPTLSFELSDTSDIGPFPELESLAIQAPSIITSGESFDWHAWRRTFPSLKHFTLYFNTNVDRSLALLDPLLNDERLYPWIKSFTAVSPDDLRPHIDQQALCQTLLNLKGLSRVDVGWDLVLLDNI